LQDGRFRSNGDLFVDPARLQHQIGAYSRVDQHIDAFFNSRAEARLFDRYAIDARFEGGNT